MRNARWILIAVVALASCSGASSAAPNERAGAHPVDAVQGIALACARHAVVMIGEGHSLRQAGDLYVRLIRDAAFQRNVRDIVVEFASRNNQPLIDRYISGEDIPLDQLRHIWRDTTKVVSWESPIYFELLTAVRDVNRKLPPQKRLRVLAGDTPVDWNKIRNHQDWAALGDNNRSIADVIEHQVLARNEHALVILGGNHVLKSGDRHGGPNTTTLVEAAYPGSTYVVLLYGSQTGGWDPATDPLLHTASLSAPTFYPLAASPIEKSALAHYADALLYLGPEGSLTTVLPPPGSFDTAYLNEVDRRSEIEWGDAQRARRYLFSKH